MIKRERNWKNLCCCSCGLSHSFMGCKQKGHTCISNPQAHNLRTEYPTGCAACWLWALVRLHMECIHNTCSHSLEGLILFCYRNYNPSKRTKQRLYFVKTFVNDRHNGRKEKRERDRHTSFELEFGSMVTGKACGLWPVTQKAMKFGQYCVSSQAKAEEDFFHKEKQGMVVILLSQMAA